MVFIYIAHDKNREKTKENFFPKVVHFTSKVQIQLKATVQREKITNT